MSADGEQHATLEHAESLTVAQSESPAQQSRVEAILTARENVLEKRREATEAYRFDVIDNQTKLAIIRYAVEDYLMEIEQLVKSIETDEDYWQEADLGSMVLPNGEEIHFHGLQSILDVPNPIRVKWSEKENDPVGGTNTTVQRASTQISMDVLMNAFRAANGFLLDIGMELDLKSEERPVFKVEPEVDLDGHDS